MNGSSIKRVGSIAVVLAALASATLAGCISFTGGITANVRNALGRDSELKVSDLDVNTYQGIVRLAGFVSSADSVAAAASVARTVKGVKSVRNDLRLE